MTTINVLATFVRREDTKDHHVYTCSPQEDCYDVGGVIRFRLGAFGAEEYIPQRIDVVRVLGRE